MTNLDTNLKKRKMIGYQNSHYYE